MEADTGGDPPVSVQDNVPSAPGHHISASLIQLFGWDKGTRTNKDAARRDIQQQLSNAVDTTQVVRSKHMQCKSNAVSKLASAKSGEWMLAIPSFDRADSEI